jgi:WYL domain
MGMTDKTENETEPAPTKVNARWGQDRRLAFIDFRLRWDGRINRSDLTDYFSISVPQASLDIARYIELAPQNLSYDRSSRVYLATEAFRPLSNESLPQRYLNDLLASTTGVIEPDASYIGWRPPMGSVPQPGREVQAETLAALLKAIREERGLQVIYQSMSRLEPSARVISPHALAHDGFRWHVRAFCHSRSKFLDFVLGRIVEVASSGEVGYDASEDIEWKRILTLVLAPHPDLAASKRRAIELDYGMTDGEGILTCRQALLSYTLKRLGLYGPLSLSPEAQQIVLKNRSKLESYLSVSQGEG